MILELTLRAISISERVGIIASKMNLLDLWINGLPIIIGYHTEV